MHWNHVVALISLLLMSPLTVEADEKTCRGTEVKELEDGCTIINEAPLIFRDLKDEALIKKKTETISIIEHGVEVIETNTESFDYLKNVTKISNKEGPAIIFRKNRKLKRFNFGGLKYLKGDPVDVVFEDDHFSSEGSSSSQSFHDWMFLEHISRSTHQRTEKCSKQFLEVRTTKESSDEDFKLPAIIAMGVFALLCIVCVGLTIHLFCHRKSVGKNDKKTTEKKNEKNKTKKSLEAGTKSLEKSKSPATETPTKSKSKSKSNPKSAEPTGSK
ncbi:hypothetical protein GCK72_017461 [Caenorhabditis remanei]|uniref:Receptor L-domain domain-containing protein n=1 Tax=Caenorhabditis remanei TaxID=31234 RepID=A0A6A5G7A5_CAERE|nr:hypothetical protein GCK72_017461 [Caenorhabditis remanei]KAF1750910.1 hypothetical protein GCK72_017461 [Caenorhabditis remanei]